MFQIVKAGMNVSEGSERVVHLIGVVLSAMISSLFFSFFFLFFFFPYNHAFFTSAVSCKM